MNCTRRTEKKKQIQTTTVITTELWGTACLADDAKTARIFSGHGETDFRRSRGYGSVLIG